MLGGVLCVGRLALIDQRCNGGTCQRRDSCGIRAREQPLAGSIITPGCNREDASVPRPRPVSVAAIGLHVRLWPKATSAALVHAVQRAHTDRPEVPRQFHSMSQGFSKGSEAGLCSRAASGIKDNKQLSWLTTHRTPLFSTNVALKRITTCPAKQSQCQSGPLPLSRKPQPVSPVAAHIEPFGAFTLVVDFHKLVRLSICNLCWEVKPGLLLPITPQVYTVARPVTLCTSLGCPSAPNELIETSFAPIPPL